MSTFVGFVDDAGHFALDNRASFLAYVRKFAGHEVVVSVKRMPRRQGNQSMRYYRGIVIPDLARACGYTDPDDFPSVHEAMAWKFLRLPDGPFGEPRRRSTAKDQMSQDEITAYIDAVITFAETTIPDCRIRRPGEVALDTIHAPEWD